MSDIDALPYVDKLFDQDEAIRQQVQALIAAEEAQIKKKKEDYVQHIQKADAFLSVPPYPVSFCEVIE